MILTLQFLSQHLTMRTDTRVVLDTDLNILSRPPAYGDWLAPITLLAAGGSILRNRIAVEVQTVKGNGEELSHRSWKNVLSS
jgi:hypothetical protein